LAVRSSLAAPLVAILAVACGPSFQTVYEGDARFEHCYALDETPDVSLEKKGACWREWIQRHTAGQTRDRVEYATQRSRALEQVAIPTDEAMMHAAPGVTDRRGLTAPAPTSAYAPPPKTTETPPPQPPPSPPTAAPAPPLPAPPPSAAPASVRPPAAACVDACGETWSGCASACGADTKGCSACDARHAQCLVRCARAVAQTPGTSLAKTR
jgi:hypothetical protein